MTEDPEIPDEGEIDEPGNGGKHLPKGELTYEIIGAALEVHKELGPGFLEAVYQEALEKEFRNRGISYEREPALRIPYKGENLKKKYRVDFTVEGSVMVETKAVTAPGKIEDAKMLNYLKAGRVFQIGLVFNFGAESLEWKRFVF